MKTLISETTKKEYCIKCKEDVDDDQNRHELPCGEFVCSQCGKGLDNEQLKNMCNKNHKDEKIDIMNELKISDYADCFKLSDLKCPIHQHSYEYFSKIDCKFACFKCLDTVINEEQKSQQIISINSKNVINDLLFLQKKLESYQFQIEEILKGSIIDGYQISKMFNGVVKFLEYVEDDFQIRDQLQVCQQKQNFSLQSKLKISNINIEQNIKVDKLVGFSKIITLEEDENFIRSLFDKKIELGILYRASEHNFNAQKFHELCDNRGPTLCIYKSQKGRIFGGFCNKIWQSDFQFKTSKKSFLFSLHYRKKMLAYRNFNRALLFSKANGPSFGEDLVIGDDCHDNLTCKSFLGRTYEICEGYDGGYDAYKNLAGNPVFSLEDYEVYIIKYI